MLQAEEDEQLHGVADNSKLRPYCRPLCGVHPSGTVMIIILILCICIIDLPLNAEIYLTLSSEIYLTLRVI